MRIINEDFNDLKKRYELLEKENKQNHENAVYWETKYNRARKINELATERHQRQILAEKEKKQKEATARELAPGIWTGTPRGDKILRIVQTALEEGIDLDTLIDTLWYNFDIEPSDSIDLIFAEAKKLGMNTSKINIDEAVKKAVKRNYQKDEVRAGRNSYRLTISQDVRDYYERQLATNPHVKLIEHEILWQPTIGRAQKRFMELKEAVASPDVKAVYDFMNSPFTSTHNT